MLGNSKLALSWRIGMVFGVRSSLILKVLYNYLTLPTCGIEIKCCQGPLFVEVSGMGFCCGKQKGRTSCVDSVVGKTVMGICFRIVSFLPVVHVCELPEFMPLMARDRSSLPRCLLWHGWLPGLGTAGERDPWAAALGQLADRSLEQALGAYPRDEAGFWAPPDFWDLEDLAIEIGEDPCLWTDGSFGTLSHGWVCCCWCWRYTFLLWSCPSRVLSWGV